ncbi:phage tail assembly chaperone, partial [Blastomonas sp. CCH1-A6]
MSAARFADAARALSGLAARLLGWRPQEFWQATPDELAAA